MRYICIALTLLFICLGNYSSAQIIKPRWSPIEYHVQNRLFQKGLGYQTFHTQIDIGFGLNKKLRLLNKFHLELGLSVNYGRFKSKTEGTLFISSFKRTNIHYFSHNSVSQLSLEIPLGFQINLLKVNENNIHFTAGIITQLGLFTMHSGKQWDENLTVRETLLSSDEPYFQSSLLSDIYLRSGFSYSFCNNKLNIGSGIEYSTFGKSFGLYTKVGCHF
ncbi:MAG: hypothetical protein ACJASM_000949 [Salibacteraceae bacterium]|jgi:hypothetical protein|tara:strand:+ start:1230 stop:1886 length:657 start_codon:yes stop_codon:yes gene_type:complete